MGSCWGAGESGLDQLAKSSIVGKETRSSMMQASTILLMPRMLQPVQPVVVGVAGESGVDQLVEIIKVLGTPSREEIHAMNPNYTEFKFPQIKAHAWSKVFSKRLPADAIDLVRPEPPLHYIILPFAVLESERDSICRPILRLLLTSTPTNNGKMQPLHVVQAAGLSSYD